MKKLTFNLVSDPDDVNKNMYFCLALTSAKVLNLLTKSHLVKYCVSVLPRFYHPLIRKTHLKRRQIFLSHNFELTL